MVGSVRQKGRADFDELFIGGTKVTPGGGDAAIQPEAGSSTIKVSAFPNAAANMGSGDTVTGLQAGGNVNFSQGQIWTASGQATLRSTYGARVFFSGGINAEVRGADSDSANGGHAGVYGGSSSVVGDGGGGAQVIGGGGTYGGDALVSSGPGNDSGYSGNVELRLATPNGAATSGKFLLTGMTSTPGSSAGTLTNAPKSGNPQTWLAVTINGVAHFIPAWHL